MRVVSPNLSTTSWQRAIGYSVRINADLRWFDPDNPPSPLWANLYVQVFDQDLQADRFFFNGTAQPIAKNSWNTFSFNWANVSTFPTHYIIRNVFVDVWGRLDTTYNLGSVYVDTVVPIMVGS